MRENRTYGSVRGALSDGRSYRDPSGQFYSLTIALLLVAPGLALGMRGRGAVREAQSLIEENLYRDTLRRAEGAQTFHRWAEERVAEQPALAQSSREHSRTSFERRDTADAQPFRAGPLRRGFVEELARIPDTRCALLLPTPQNASGAGAST
jgi:hypothetical protein